MIADMPAKSAIKDPWLTLDTELDIWAENGHTATLWWRDDDAIAPGPKLDRLLDITRTSGLLLAVIPAQVKVALANTVASVSHVKVGQHGYAHRNHAARGRGQGAWELGLHRGEPAVLAELDVGRARLDALFDGNFIPVIVPPWNHLDPALIAPIAARGYRGVSGFGPRVNQPLVTDFIIANTHCDLISWKTGARFKGELKTLEQLVHHLVARRTDTADSQEPTGFLTHHSDLDEPGWDFCRRLVATIDTHPAAVWCNNVAEIFGVDV